jgi:energy-coupling factor transport system substrate-specific component
LLTAFSYFHAHRPPIRYGLDYTLYDYLVIYSDIWLGLFFLLASAIPFMLVYDRRRAQARDLVPIAVMSAIAVAGRAAFAIIPIPHFRPVSAIVIITALAFGPESGFLTGALTAFVSNFLFGQGPWTPWQMFCWGMIGFIAGILNNAGLFRKKEGKDYFKSKRWDKLCPECTNRGDMLLFARQIGSHAPMTLCIYGLLTGFGYGWVMNIYYLIGYLDNITWLTILPLYVSSFFFDLSQGVCTFLVLWALAEPWGRKLERIKVKFGLVGEAKNYEMPSIPAAVSENQAEVLT